MCRFSREVKNSSLKRYLCRHAASVLLCSSLALSLAAAETPLFHETFSSPPESHARWTTLTADNAPLVFNEGKATLVNTSNIYSGFALHPFSGQVTAYASSAQIFSMSAGTGLFCPTGTIDGVLTGYAVIWGDNELLLLSYGKEGISRIVSHPTRFADPFENVIGISGGGGRIRLFCNGFYQFSHPDTFGEATGVGIVVPPQSSAVFDEVVVRRGSADTLSFSEIIDSLDTLPHWLHRFGNGYADTSRGSVVMVAEKGQCLYAGVDVPVGDFALSLVMSTAVADSAARVGLYTGKKDSTLQGVLPQVRFSVSMQGALIVDEAHSSGFTTIINKKGAFAVKDTGEWVVISLTRTGSKHVFCMDGETVLALEHAGSPSFALGMFVEGGIRAAMKNLRCSGGGNTSTQLVVSRGSQIREVYHSPLLVSAVDLLGRKNTVQLHFGKSVYQPKQCIIKAGKKIVTGVTQLH